MSILYEVGDHPADVMLRVSSVMSFVSEMLAVIPPQESLELSPEALSGLSYITLECTQALKKVSETM